MFCSCTSPFWSVLISMSAAFLPAAPPRRGSTMDGGGGGLAAPPLDVRSSIAAALDMVSDCETRQAGVECLEELVKRRWSAEGIAVVLACLYDAELGRKGEVSRECVRMFGCMAALYADLVSPHLPRIVCNIVQRLKDEDVGVRRVCVEVIGELAGHVPYPVGGGGNRGDILAVAASTASAGVYMKPLLDALSEQNPGVQLGASQCLSRVFEVMQQQVPTGVLQRLVPRIVKLMNSPSFSAKANLLAVIGNMAAALEAAGAAGPPLFSALLPCLLKCLESGEWTVRKAAADTLARCVAVLGAALCPFKLAIVPALEARCFDKVKVVREVVDDAITLWKDLPGGEVEVSSLDKMKLAAQSAPRHSSQAVTGLTMSRGLFGSYELTPDSSFIASSGDWTSSRSLDDNQAVYAPYEGVMEMDIPGTTGRTQQLSTGSCDVRRYLPAVQEGQAESVGQGSNTISDDRSLDGTTTIDTTSQECSGPPRDTTSCDTSSGTDPRAWSVIWRHLRYVEEYQTKLMESFQCFVRSSQEGVASLQLTMREIDGAVNQLRQEFAALKAEAADRRGKESYFGTVREKVTEHGARKPTGEKRPFVQLEGESGRTAWPQPYSHGFLGEALHKEIRKLDLNQFPASMSS